ncbi:tetratricopeptide repeat protein [Zeaxanthinibacter sp. PT1]|uniref:tetratricopeptide repeat protein n=1 Tax=Zeaxanthinibacter TaxID=561554 RepID=UPI00234AA6BD|nr:tetratricopeptide repeat protein [Zeaxanthinibacter sp. PT1]MDC6350864.1 tetratricopeptide repeat protein [Zeaxanthinibacter sp. PT1]
MKNILILISLFSTLLAFSQAKAEQEDLKALKSSRNLTYEANEDLQEEQFVSAEAKYRRAIDKSKTNVAAPYNLGNAYYERDSYLEAFSRFKEAGENAGSKTDKHRAFHNMGNVFMKNKEYQKAVEAYKEALRNNPSDEETRYNLALAKEMLKKQQEEQPEQDKEDKQDQQDQKDEQNQDKEEQDGGDQQDNNDQQDQDKGDKQEGEDGDQGEQEKEDNKEGQGDEKQEKKEPRESDQQQPRPNQLSPQQIENLLEAMQNEEKKVQEKMDAKKVKGVPVKNKKDW